MRLESIDWAIVFLFFAVALAIGAVVSRQAGRNASEFFLSGRHMPWWLLGFSMVATTFAADTPLLVTNIVRKNGVAGNWEWWAFLLTGMLTVFVYARLWRRSGVLTDIEFYELRYSGKPAAFLRGFRAVYLGVFFNIMIMANVTLAATKIGEVMLGFSPLKTILVASVVTVIFSALGGLRAVLLTDLLLFLVAMGGAIGAAIVAGPVARSRWSASAADSQRSSRQAVLSTCVRSSMTEQLNVLITVLIMPLAVQWWSVWYPGAEPGGGGYIAQRMLAAKDESHATGATLLFNAAHYALRPWPWILVALASLIVFPDLQSLRDAFPQAVNGRSRSGLSGHADVHADRPARPGRGFLDRCVHVDDFHALELGILVCRQRLLEAVRGSAGERERELVALGRISTVVMMILAAAIALWLENAYQGFKILLQIGAGTGLLFILRWFWWRINAFSELTAMIVSFLVAVWSQRLPPTLFRGGSGPSTVCRSGSNRCLGAPTTMPDWGKLVVGVAITTFAWLVVTFLTRPTDERTLAELLPVGLARGARLAPRTWSGPWPIRRWARSWPSFPTAPIATGIQCMFLGCVAVYGVLFATGFWLYGSHLKSAMLIGVVLLATLQLIRLWRPVHGQKSRSTELQQHSFEFRVNRCGKNLLRR